MSYRALRFARGDQKELHGFEQDDYVREARFQRAQLDDLLEEFESVRESSIAMFRSLPPGAVTRPAWPTAIAGQRARLAYIVGRSYQASLRTVESQLRRTRPQSAAPLNRNGDDAPRRGRIVILNALWES